MIKSPRGPSRGPLGTQTGVSVSSMPPEALYFPVGSTVDLHTWGPAHAIKEERAVITAWLDHGVIVTTMIGVKYFPYSSIHHLSLRD